MQITVKGKGFDVTEALRSHATHRADKMTRYSDGVITVEVTLTTERNWHIAEVTLFGKGFDMRGEEKTKDMFHSIDRVIDKLERQLKKQREKTTNHRARTSDSAEPEPIPSPRVAPRVGLRKRILPTHPGSTKPTVTQVQPLTLEQAIKEMEAHGYSFYCFLNEDVDRINVVHKTSKGYGLVDPRIED